MFAMDKLERLADLSNKYDAGTFGQYEVIADDSLEQLTAFDPGFVGRSVGDNVVIQIVQYRYKSGG